VFRLRWAVQYAGDHFVHVFPIVLLRFRPLFQKGFDPIAQQQHAIHGGGHHGGQRDAKDVRKVVLFQVPLESGSQLGGAAADDERVLRVRTSRCLGGHGAICAGQFAEQVLGRFVDQEVRVQLRLRREAGQQGSQIRHILGLGRGLGK